MKVLIFGLENEDFIIPQLRKHFPSIGFKKAHSHDAIETEGRDLIVFQSFPDIDRVMFIDHLPAMRLDKALDDHDLVVTLRVMLEIDALDSVKIVAVPKNYSKERALSEIKSVLSLLTSHDF